MVEAFNAVFVSLHVRVTNRAAFSLYKDTLGFKVGKCIQDTTCTSLISHLRFTKSKQNTMLMVKTRMPCGRSYASSLLKNNQNPKNGTNSSEIAFPTQNKPAKRISFFYSKKYTSHLGSEKHLLQHQILGIKCILDSRCLCQGSPFRQHRKRIRWYLMKKSLIRRSRTEKRSSLSEPGFQGEPP